MLRAILNRIRNMEVEQITTFRMYWLFEEHELHLRY